MNDYVAMSHTIGQHRSIKPQPKGQKATVGSASDLVIGGYLSVVSSSQFKGSCCFLDQDTLPSLLSTVWYQERIRACIT